jgi:hypothetical protein
MKIYLESLERSGGTFFSFAIALSTGIDVTRKTDHMLSTLKEYDQEYPFIVALRDALPSIVSSKIYRDYMYNNKLYNSYDIENTLLETIIGRYKEYTEYLLDNPKFFIAPFQEFTKDHNKVIGVIAHTYPSIKNVKQTTYKEISERAESVINTIYEPEIGNLPRKTNEIKDEIENLILKNYSEDIKLIQSNINKLYNRYYALELEYNKHMTGDRK